MDDYVDEQPILLLQIVSCRVGYNLILIVEVVLKLKDPLQVVALLWRVYSSLQVCLFVICMTKNVDN